VPHARSDSDAIAGNQSESWLCKETPLPIQPNPRSTRQTELGEEFPLHVVCAWIDNSQPVAAKHYLQVTDEHFTVAAADKPEEETEGAQKAAQ
jgi:hypothetical protein